jgi:hypothetical protein
MGGPVTMRLFFDDGSSVDTVIAPNAGRHRLIYEAGRPVRGVVIDPDGVYALDPHLLDNSLVPDACDGCGLRLLSGLTYLVEIFFGGLWGW